MPRWPGTLKCVSASSPARPLREAVEAALRAHIPAEDVRHLYGDILVVYTEEDTAALRDWLAPLLEDGESLFVVEFERWSSAGPAIDREWLGARGH